jgi:hypothetical protein
MTAKRADPSNIKPIDPILIFQRFLVVAKRPIMPERGCFKHKLYAVPSPLFDNDGNKRRPNKPD